MGFLGSTRDPNARTFLRETEEAAARLGLQVQSVLVGGPEEFEGAISGLRGLGVEALMVQPIFASRAAAIAELATQHGLATASIVSTARAGV
ncbi:MAG: hypothetical protein K0Q60_4693, partial [Microvirga sp.]|nr:hypothetical protein [Microvirga sp.]